MRGRRGHGRAARRRPRGVETARLFEALDDDPPDTGDLEGEASAFTTAKAERDWRTAEDETVDGPDFG